jgi:ABC-type multidrug transport system fused ATPase/permease subunit
MADAMQTTALVGQSGSGKSTVVSLIERFYDATGGTIRIGRSSIKEYVCLYSLCI